MTAADLIAAARTFEQEHGAGDLLTIVYDIMLECEQRNGLIPQDDDDEAEIELVSLH